MNSPLLEKISASKNIFSFFDEVYIFGSALTDKYPGDVDILLIYNEYSYTLVSEQLQILEKMSKKIDNEAVLDFTVLSRKEQEEVNFLKEIKNYRKIYP